MNCDVTQLDVASRFDRERPRLRSVAYRILGSLSDSEDAVQEAWLRLQRAQPAEIANLERWLTTVVARICLNILRARRARPEEPLETFAPEPVVSSDSETNPEHEAILAESVGIALQVVLGALNPSERVAFVLHDMFGVPFEDIALLIERSPEASRQLASRVQRRVRGAAPPPDPDVVARSHGRTGVFELRGVEKVARAAMLAREFAPFVRAALINGTAGAVAFDGDAPFAILAFTVVGGRAVTIDVFNDRELVPRLVRSSG